MHKSPENGHKSPLIPHKNPTLKKKVAWRIDEFIEGYAVIVFHHHGLAARRIGAAELNNEFEDVECRREPDYDIYAEQGSVPISRLLEDGWWCECFNCGHQVMHEEREPEENTPPEEILILGDRVFCNQHCKRTLDDKIDNQNKKFEEFQSRLTNSRPDLEFSKFFGKYPARTMTAEFKFPGAKYGGSVRDDGDGDLKCFVASCDAELFNQYEKSRKNGVSHEG